MTRLARIVGAFEHPGRRLPDITLETLYLEIMAGALRDPGLPPDDVDGLICPTVPDGPVTLVQTLGLNNLRFADSTDIDGVSYVSDAGGAARLVEAGLCSVVLVIMAGLPLQRQIPPLWPAPSEPFETAHGWTIPAQYALVARRHMYEYGTTSRDLAEIKVSASYHAQFNPHALLPRPNTVEEVLDSPWVAEPLHRLDCCAITDGGGAYIVASRRHDGGDRLRVGLRLVHDHPADEPRMPGAAAARTQQRGRGRCAPRPHGRIPVNTDGGGPVQQPTPTSARRHDPHAGSRPTTARHRRAGGPARRSRVRDRPRQ